MDVKTLCLGVLSFGEATGYEIRKQFEEGPFAYFYEAGYGSIYPALGKLAAEGLATCTEMTQSGRPDKKVYRITDAGVAALRQALRRTPGRDRLRSDHLFMLFLAHHLEPGQLRAVQRSYHETHRSYVAEMEGGDGKSCAELAAKFEGAPGAGFVRGLGLAVYRAIAAYMEENAHLLDDAARDGVKDREGGR